MPAPYTLAPPPFITHEPFIVESCGRCHITQQRVPVSLVKVMPAPYTLVTPHFITREPLVVEPCGRRRRTRQSFGFTVPGRVGRRPASIPDAQGARARSSLLAALIIIIFFCSVMLLCVITCCVCVSLRISVEMSVCF